MSQWYYDISDKIVKNSKPHDIENLFNVNLIQKK